MRPNREGGGWQEEERFPDLKARLEAFSSCKTSATVLGGVPSGIKQPDTARGRRLSRQGLPCRLRPSSRALPALLPRVCCEGRHRNDTGLTPPTCTRTVSFPRVPSFKALQIYRRQKRR